MVGRTLALIGPNLVVVLAGPVAPAVLVALVHMLGFVRGPDSRPRPDIVDWCWCEVHTMEHLDGAVVVEAVGHGLGEIGAAAAVAAGVHEGGGN